MAKIHVLSGDSNNLYTVVVHATAPSGSNLAGVLWSDAIKNSGRAKTILTVGNGAGQITQSEMNQITSGALIEAVLHWGDDPTWTNAQRVVDLDLRATQLTTELLDRYNAELKYFGFTRT